MKKFERKYGHLIFTHHAHQFDKCFMYAYHSTMIFDSYIIESFMSPHMTIHKIKHSDGRIERKFVNI